MFLYYLFYFCHSCPSPLFIKKMDCSFIGFVYALILNIPPKKFLEFALFFLKWLLWRIDKSVMYDFHYFRLQQSLFTWNISAIFEHSIFWEFKNGLKIQIFFSAKNYELDRSRIELGEILGEGQFGDVHNGTFVGKDGNLVPVAVKTCKGDADLATTEKFLEEACESILPNYFGEMWDLNHYPNMVPFRFYE